MQLRDHHALCSVHNKGSSWGHVGDRSQIHVLYDRLKILVFRIRAVQFQSRLQRHAEGQSTFDALFLRIAWRVHEVVEEFQHELIARIRDGKIF